MTVDFVPQDYHALDALIYDCKHGYVPHTGKRVLHVDPKECVTLSAEEHGSEAVVCIVDVREILKWFGDAKTIGGFLQKNVRDFLGEGGTINREIARSYLKEPSWFWYKHNGIIMFADSVSLETETGELTLRNPQIVNGGQTVKTLYIAYNSNERKDNGAKVLLRVYRLAHDHGAGYKHSLEIISALNTQNKINPSDLRSTDPRQVRLERLFPQIGMYQYFRKRAVDIKASANNVTMRKLAILYHVCRKYARHEGMEGKVEELFEEEGKYDQIFDENSINKPITDNHVVYKYATCWSLDQAIKKIELPEKKQREFFPLLKWFLLADAYQKLTRWKQERPFPFAGTTWLEFLQSTPFQVHFNQYGRAAIAKGIGIVPSYEEPRSFLKRKEAGDKFMKVAGVKRFKAAMNQALGSFAKQRGLSL
jgi:AIPR protein